MGAILIPYVTDKIIVPAILSDIARQNTPIKQRTNDVQTEVLQIIVGMVQETV